MTTKYPLAVPNRFSLQYLLRNTIFLAAMLCLCFMGYAQKGKVGGGNNDLILHTCIQVLDNGLIRAEFGYTNPTDQDIIVDIDDSVVFLSDKDDDDESRGIKKTEGTTTFLPGTHDKVFGVVFNSNGHAKWTVTIKNKETKIRATAASTVCVDPCVICPVYGGAGKSFTPIGSELTALATGNAGEQPSDIIYQINPEDPTEVLIEIVPKVGRMQFVLDLLEASSPAGFARVYNADPLVSDFILDPAIIGSLDPATQATKYATIDVYFPISRLLELNDYPDDLNFSRSLYTPLRQAGVANTKGDNAMLTNNVRESFVLRDINENPIFVNGNGISVAVISDSFDKQPFSVGQPSKATLDINQGDLSPVQVLKEYPFGEASDEGRAMLQLIHDVAPGAKLGFSTGVLSPRDMALAIDNLALEEYDIITDDITYPLEPFYDDFTTDDDDGSIAKAIKNFTDDGGIYVTSAGNFANTGYQSVFVNSTATPVTIPALDPGTIAHVFDTQNGIEDMIQEIEVDPGTYFLVLQWDEDQASQNNSMGAATDLDIYIISEFGQVLVNTNRTNELGDAVEAVVFQSVAENARANIMITSANGPAPANLAFRYIIYRSDGLQILEYNTGTPTVTGHAMTPEAITVGAVDYRLVLKEETIIPEFFSSFAGDLLNETTLQIDIAAPDGGNTTVGSVGNDINDITEGDPDDEELPNFFGTSAAAPHVAGAAALLLSTALPPSEPGAYSPSWYPDGLPYEVLELFQNNAIAVSDNLDLFSAGSGVAQAGMYGLINAVAAFKQIAVQTAVIEDFEVVTEGEINPGVDTYNVTISGNYIPSDATVFLGDEELQILGEITDTQITVISVVPFVGNPELTVFTNSGDLPGGGKSNGLSILPDGKIALKITANNITVEFGDTPKFTYTVEGLPKLEGLPNYDEVVFGDGETLNTAIENINVALTDLGQPEMLLLPDLVLAAENAVGPFPDVAFYGISASFGEVDLTAEQMAAYQINFINPDDEEAGRLTITKKDLIVQPQDISVEYGEVVTVILDYFGFNEEGQVPLDTQLRTTLIEAHSDDFYEENTLILINKLRAVINEQQILNVLENGSWMASGKMFETNKLRAVINGELNFIDLEVENFDNYIASIGEGEDPVTNKLRAVINKLRAVINGEDLLNNQINLEDPETNKLRAVINGTALLNQNDFEAYESIFAVVDWDDGNETDENGDPIDPDNPNFNEVYATNLLSSLDVTVDLNGNLLDPENPFNKVYPGAILSNFGANFNTQYLSAELTVKPATLSVQTPNLEIDYGVAITMETINSLIDDCDCPGLVIEGYVYDENETIVFPDGISYYFVDDSGEYELGDELGVGNYEIRIRAPQNYVIGVESLIGTLEVLKKSLAVETGDLVIDEGSTIDINDITTTITGYVYYETQSVVFPEGIQYSIEDKDGNLYSPGATGVYFIKIKEPQDYTIQYIRIGTVYINPINDLRKIRTYTDCVELNPDDPDGLNYIAHFRYINPNDRSIYILPDGSENQLTGSGAPTAKGELPINFLPGEHTFEIRFDGNPLKWEVISMDSNHKTSTTTEVNANSNKCNTNNSNNESGIPTYVLHPNPVNGILYIDQDVPAIITIDVFDFFGILHLNTVRDGTNAPITHTIDMSGSNYPVGVYFVCLTANSNVQVFSVIKAE